MTDLFVDRLGNVTIANGVARLDFLRIEQIDAEQKKINLTPALRLAMPVGDLMQAIAMLDKLKAGLEQQVAAAKAQQEAAAPDTKLN